jgi:hypothetical protein
MGPAIAIKDLNVVLILFILIQKASASSHFNAIPKKHGCALFPKLRSMGRYTSRKSDWKSYWTVTLKFFNNRCIATQFGRGIVATKY